MKFIVDLDLDGYETEEEMEQACIAFIEESIDFSASSVSVSKYILEVCPRCKESYEGM